jgi:hypothetical protein
MHDVILWLTVQNFTEMQQQQGKKALLHWLVKT